MKYMLLICVSLTVLYTLHINNVYDNVLPNFMVYWFCNCWWCRWTCCVGCKRKGLWRHCSKGVYVSDT